MIFCPRKTCFQSTVRFRRSPLPVAQWAKCTEHVFVQNTPWTAQARVGKCWKFHRISWDFMDFVRDWSWWCNRWFNMVIFGFLGFLDVFHVFPCFSMFFGYFFGEAGHPEYPFLAVLAQVATWGMWQSRSSIQGSLTAPSWTSISCLSAEIWVKSGAVVRRSLEMCRMGLLFPLILA